ncbi:MAG: glycogen synthase [Oscillospiraceae bacterium]|jgi:starch synthase|nr:glycogen synthase [Oscillospiraceae bacterium]
MNVLFAAGEAAPFIKTGGLGDVAGSLPKALCEAGCDTRVILPLYGRIDEAWRNQMEYLLYTYVDVAWRHLYCGLFRLEFEGVTYYFVDNEFYFGRGKVYGELDDAERFAFFSKAVVSLLPRLDWTPDVVHCNDWQTALIPIWLREFGGFYKTVFTIHNIEYQGRYAKIVSDDVFGLPEWLYSTGITRFDNDVNLLKGAIYQADAVSTVSPSYARELLDPFYACGLELAIADNAYKFRGIINGLDEARYDPAADPLLAENYSAASPEGKLICKQALCELLGLGTDYETPIIACVSRLVGHKGFDLVAGAVDEIVARGAKLVILGTGDKYFEGIFADAERRYPGRVSASIMYSEARAMAVYAGSDMFLMPSRSEPCGLSQLIAMRYGSVPIVRAVGGLRDTVTNYGTENSGGFTFDDYTVRGMLGALDYALQIWRDPAAWRELMLGDLRRSFSWAAPAEEYIKMYEDITR